VRGQGFGGGVFAVEFEFREYGVHLLVAGSTDENDGMTLRIRFTQPGRGTFGEPVN
jgi:hypothetical protein